MTRTEKRATSRAALLTAATTIFKEVGYERATLRDIARRAGLSTGAIFNNWPDKDNLYLEAMGRQPMTAERAETLREAAEDLLKNLQSDFKMDNGHVRGIQAEDGEKCYIIHSDYVHALQSAIGAEVRA